MSEKMSKKEEIKMNYPIEFEISRDYLKKIKKSHKNFIGPYDDNHILSCYHFEIEGNKMSVTTTDGSRLLKSSFEVNNLTGQDIKFNILGYMIKNLVVMKSSLINFMNVQVDRDKITFNDSFYGLSITYKLFNPEQPFPKTEDLIKSYRDRETYSISFNHNFFNDLKELESSERSRVITMNCNKNDNMQAILIDTGSVDFAQTALLMPIKVN